MTRPRCCTSPPLCFGPRGTAERPPCASDSTTRSSGETTSLTLARRTAAGSKCGGGEAGVTFIVVVKIKPDH